MKLDFQVTYFLIVVICYIAVYRFKVNELTKKYKITLASLHLTTQNKFSIHEGKKTMFKIKILNIFKVSHSQGSFKTS